VIPPRVVRTSSAVTLGGIADGFEDLHDAMAKIINRLKCRKFIIL